MTQFNPCLWTAKDHPEGMVCPICSRLDGTCAGRRMRKNGIIDVMRKFHEDMAVIAAIIASQNVIKNKLIKKKSIEYRPPKRSVIL